LIDLDDYEFTVPSFSICAADVKEQLSDELQNHPDIDNFLISELPEWVSSLKLEETRDAVISAAAMCVEEKFDDWLEKDRRQDTLNVLNALMRGDDEPITGETF
jgi:hypothetical protein